MVVDRAPFLSDILCSFVHLGCDACTAASSIILARAVTGHVPRFYNSWSAR